MWAVWAWLSRGVGAVGIVGALIFSPFATQAAQADEWDEALMVLTTVGGGVVATAPGTMTAAAGAEAGAVAATATACAATVICGGVMVAVGVGLLAYTSKDAWVPWIVGYPEDGPADPGSGPTSGTPACGYVTSNWRLPDPCYSPDEVMAVLVNTAGPNNMTRLVEQGASCGNMGWNPNGTLGGAIGAVRKFYSLCSGAYGEPGAVTGTMSVPAVGEANALNPYIAPGAGTSSATTVTTTNKVCQRPDGSQYTDARSVSGVTTSIPVGWCQPGDKAVSLGVTVTPAGGSPIATQTLPLSPTAVDVTNYPLCAGAACAYQILIDGHPCRVGMAGCSEWWAISQATPARITARYGPYGVPWITLRWLTHAYDNSTGTKVTTTTKDGTKPATDPVPDAIVEPPALTDPVPIPNGPLPNPIPAPQNTGDCFGGTVSWNPVDWVVTPIKCALSWAFVPPAGSLGGPFGEFSTLYSSRPPGSVVGAATDVVGGLGAGWSGACVGAGSADFSPDIAPGALRLPCRPAGGGPGSVPYTLMQVALVVFTCFGLWHMVAGAVGGQATGGD